MSRKWKLSHPAFSSEVYKAYSLNDLILASIYLVTMKGETCTFERLVAECFNNFPEVFSFKRYPQWPDALRFDRPLRTLRAKGLIIGSPRDKFSLNKYGESKAKDILRKLTKKVPIIKSKGNFKSPVRSADDRIIEFIKSSAPYLRYLSNPKNFSISEQEFRNLLRCTLESSDRVVNQNLQYYLKLAKEYKEVEILKLLMVCKKRFLKGENNGKGFAN